jgi:hypothetical protein
MVEKLSKEQQAEYAEEAEYYEETHAKDRSPKREKRESHEHDWEPERREHEKHEARESRSNEIREREEMMEEVEYHETYHQAPRGKTPKKESPMPDYDVKQPGHGQTLFLSPFEISQYKEEISYSEKNHPRSKQASPLSPLESTGFEMGFIRHGEKGSMKSMPEGMMGYDLEVGYFHNVSQRDNPLVNPRGTEMFAGPIGPQKSRGRRVTDAMRGFGEGLLSARDQLYGYRRIPLGPDTNMWRLDRGSVNRSTVGRIDFFRDRGGSRLMSMDPFHLSGHSRAKPGKKKRGRPAGSRSSRSDGGLGGGLPPSLAWMF